LGDYRNRIFIQDTELFSEMNIRTKREVFYYVNLCGL